jgi:hypothetical protein
MARVGAPYRFGVTVSPTGELGPTSSGAFKIRWLGRKNFRMSAWEPPRRWEWVGGLPGVRIYYDHRFEPSGPRSTQLEWLVALRGPLAPLLRRVFARIYGRNVDRAIPRLQEWFRRPGPGQGRTAHEQGQRGDGDAIITWACEGPSILDGSPITFGEEGHQLRGKPCRPIFGKEMTRAGDHRQASARDRLAQPPSDVGIEPAILLAPQHHRGCANLGVQRLDLASEPFVELRYLAVVRGLPWCSRATVAGTAGAPRRSSPERSRSGCAWRSSAGGCARGSV